MNPHHSTSLRLEADARRAASIASARNRGTKYYVTCIWSYAAETYRYRVAKLDLGHDYVIAVYLDGADILDS